MTTPITRKTFFSFHYDNDSTRAAVVRNSNVVRSSTIQAVSRTPDFADKAEWESIKREGPQSVRNWISKQLHGTSVTVVLIGEETASRPWVKYEIEESVKRGNGILGVRIHSIKNLQSQTSSRGVNPFDIMYNPNNSKQTLTQSGIKVYDWQLHDGYTNLAQWIREAADHAGS